MKIILSALLSLCLVACTNTNSAQAAPQVVFQTNHGEFVIELFADKAPISTKNFLEYVQSGFYSGLIFHRVIPDFMVQGGGFKPDLSRVNTKAPIKNEATNGIKNTRGTVAMARTADPDSATSQFFINLVDNAYLDNRGTSPSQMGYAVFGKVVSGMDVVDKIAKVKTQCPSKGGGPCTATLPPGMRDVPEEPVIIEKAQVK